MPTIHYDIRIEDHAAFSDRMNSVAVSQALKRRLITRSPLVVLLALVLMSALSSAAFFWNGRSIGGILLAALSLYTLYGWIRLRRRMSAGSLTTRLNELMTRQFDAGELRLPLGPQSITLNDDGFDFVRDGVEARYAWRAIDRVESIPQQILIFDQSHGAIIVPKRAFVTPQAAQDFENEIESRLQNSRERHPPVLRGATRELIRIDPDAAAAERRHTLAPGASPG